MICSLKTKLKTSEICFGTWVQIGHPTVPDLLELLGFDWLVFDSEHAPLGPETIGRMIPAIDESKTCPMVRVGAIDPYLIKSALDIGAHGVVCPLVNSEKDAREALRFAKYPPEGIRGAGPGRASGYGLNFSDYVRTANSNTIVVAQIETKQALDNLDEILSVEGIDIAFVGPSDLTMSLGLVDDRANPKVIDSMKYVVNCCESHGKVPGVMAANEEEARRAVTLGFRFISLGSDLRFMARGARAFWESVRK